ncbi:MAG: hypothetical protein OHK0017_08430 [Patescibacteria group bacterium]
MPFNSPIVLEKDFLGQTLRLESGALALQANGNVVVTLGGTTVMANVVVGKEDKDGDYFPLQVIYEERLYASGKIKGSRFIKREARPSDNAILTGRLVDRSIRSLFDPRLRREIQVIITILSLDEINPPDTLAVLAASAAIQKAGLGHLCKPISSLKVALVQPKHHFVSNLIKNFDPENAEKLAMNLDISKRAEDKELFGYVFGILKNRDQAAAQQLKDIYQHVKSGVNKGLEDDLTSRAQFDREYVVNPSYYELQHSILDLVVSGDGENIMMVEAGAQEVTEEQMSDAFDILTDYLKTLTEMIKEFKAECEAKGTIKPVDLKIDEAPAHILNYLQTNRADLEAAVFVQGTKEEREQAMKAFKEKYLVGTDLLISYLNAKKDDAEKAENALQKLRDSGSPLITLAEANWSEEELVRTGKVKGWLEQTLYDYITDLIRQGAIKAKKRADGRALDQTRPISCEVGVLARTHGSSLFNRGETQVLNVLTLGSTSDAQTLDEMEDFEEQTKRYIHHYNFPSYSVGETGRYGAPGRREIGHGALAERALVPVLPSEEEFPYTIRLVSECLGSNGSTSMASTCASTLSLLDAGVPIKKMVAGVAMGLMLDSQTGEYEVLTDIQGLEDHHGDMDFKVTGTDDGITALQLDNKAAGLTPAILKEALHRAKAGRMHILGIMRQVIDQPRAKLSPYAPRVMSLTIPMDKIVDVIGPSGKIIKGIIAKTNVDIDIEDKTGKTFIFGKDAQMVEMAYNIIRDIIREYEKGEEVEGEVFRVETFGAFVRLGNGKEGLVHISELAPYRVGKTEDITKVGDRMKCEVLGLNEKGQLMLSHKKFETRKPPEEIKRPRPDQE